jgi:hypothetical protein
MKKVTFILAFGAMLALTACGSGSTATETTDSTVAPVADTTAVVADSTVAPVEGGVVKEDAEKSVSTETVK